MERLIRDRSFSYLKIPTTDPLASLQFYEGVFGWNIHARDSGRPSFDDATGYVSGSWELDQRPSTEAGLLPFIYVDDIDEAVGRIREHGGSIVKGAVPGGRSVGGDIPRPDGEHARALARRSALSRSKLCCA